MHNKLIDVSIVTMIGNLPGIINKNNKMIGEEFSYVFLYDEDNGKRPRLTADVDCQSVTAQTGQFQNLTFRGVSLNPSVITEFNTLDASVTDHEARITSLEETISGRYSNSLYVSSGVNESSQATRSSSVSSYDVSRLFQTGKSATKV